MHPDRRKYYQGLCSVSQFDIFKVRQSDRMDMMRIPDLTVET